MASEDRKEFARIPIKSRKIKKGDLNMYKKEIRNSKALIVFCLFAVAFGAGNFMWGMVSGRPFSIISGLFCAIVCGFCVMRSIKTIESYVRMEQQAKALIERQKDFMEIMNKIRERMSEQMAWIKCTDRMPPDKKPVIVTVNDRGIKYVFSGAIWDAEKRIWKYKVNYELGKMEEYEAEITYWMHMPEPAED